LTVLAVGFPSATLGTNSNTPVVPSGANTFLGVGTPFGARYSSSRNDPFLEVRSAARGAPSVTTLRFSAPTPTGTWGFVLGDIDADQVQITATHSGGAPVPAGALGFQSTFNYCATTPRPAGCTGAGPFTDMPTWDPGTATLRGNGPDTFGAAGWFQPTIPLSSVTLAYTVPRGIPIYQIWAAALTATITGTVVATGQPSPPATIVELRHPDGSPVLDAANDPITTTTGADGSYTFAGIGADTYQKAQTRSRHLPRPCRHPHRARP
jgi:hypothetical protein